MTKDEEPHEAALAFHGLVMNGGVLHALEALPAEAVQAAIDAFEGAHLQPVARLIKQTRTQLATLPADDRRLDELELQSDSRYHELIASDQALEEVFASADERFGTSREHARTQTVVSGADVQLALAEFRASIEQESREKTISGHNRYAVLTHQIAQQLRRSEAGRQAIESLLADASEHVRYMAAAVALRWEAPQAIEVLEKVQSSKTGGFDAVAAKFVLRDYRRGTLGGMMSDAELDRETQ
jgi:hypothetical protein